MLPNILKIRLEVFSTLLCCSCNSTSNVKVLKAATSFCIKYKLQKVLHHDLLVNTKLLKTYYLLFIYIFYITLRGFTKIDKLIQHATTLYYYYITYITLKSLVTKRMNEIFPCLTCYGQKLFFFFGNRHKDKHKLCERKQQRWNWSNFSKKWYLRSVLTSCCLWSFANNYTVH